MPNYMHMPFSVFLCSDVLSKTLSHMWGKLNLPMFLFNVGLLTFGERYKEHLKDPSPIHLHSNLTGHPTSHNNFQIIGREGHSLARYIKDSIFIRVNNPTLNRNIGKFNFPHIWDRVLLKMPGLNLERHVHAVGHVNSNNFNTPLTF